MLLYDGLLEVLDSMYDELLVYDNNYKIIYANKACMRHYGIAGKDLIGKDFHEAFSLYWKEPAVLPTVYRTKKIHAAKAKTRMGATITTVAVPILDDEGEVKYVVMNVRDEINPKSLYGLDNTIDENEDAFCGNIVSASEKMIVFKHMVEKLGNVDAPCILYGETGTGKSMYAKYMHDIGPRKDKPFIYVNCAAIPAELMESELFGYAKGAFTGAKPTGQEGLLKAADGGTIFFDEISELDYRLQSKLLHFLQDYTFRPVGSDKSITVDVKVISATNKNLKQMVDSNQFREDLYYRLNVFELKVPPLRERPEDITALSYSFLTSLCEKYHVTHEISNDVLAVFKQYSWPGNVRELKHVIERLVVIVDNILIDKNDLPNHMFLFNERNTDQAIQFQGESYDSLMDKYECEMVKEAYKNYPSSRKLASFLNITQSKASRLISKWIMQE